MSGNLIVAAAIFIASVAVAIGLSLFVITVVLRMQARHRKRLARVGRKRMSGRLDLDDARAMLLRQKQEANVLLTITNALARFIPLLDTTRLRANFRRAGLQWSISTFVLISLGLGGIIVAGGVLFSGRSVWLALIPGLFSGMLLVDRFVKFRGGRRANRFMKQLPEAIDTIIRGIRSGLPVIECIGSVGHEYDDPVGGHFQAISERVMLGEPLDTALWRVARVIDKPEMDFFAISIAIQVETGGSLAEALGNLADLLRKREQMKLKIRAISSEARASAFIIGALPFLMLGLLMMMSPEYVMPLFLDPRGQMMLGAGFTSISLGAFVMWRMTQFEIEEANVDVHPLVFAGAGAAFVCFLTLAWATQQIYDKRARMQRVRTATGRRQGRVVTSTGLKPPKNTQLQQGALAFMKASTKGLSIMKGRQINETRKLLVSGGFRSRDAIVVYTFFKLVSPLIFLAAAALYVYGTDPIGKGAALDAAAVVAAALIGSKVPDLFIKNVRQKRLESIRKALPDSLDMLVICAEAGLSSDAALKRVVAETSRKSSVLGEELNQTALELSFMPERRQALENLAERAPLPSVNAFVNTMIQAEKYGTPLARAFKVLSQEQRTERMLRAEEKAGRLPATMTVPMMIFILPALFIVLIGPAVLDILDNFINMNQ